MFGLIKAIDNFDVSLNVQFSTYAVPMIIGEIRRYLRDNNPIRVSRSVRDLAYRALQARKAVRQRKAAAQAKVPQRAVPINRRLRAAQANLHPREARAQVKAR